MGNRLRGFGGLAALAALAAGGVGCDGDAEAISPQEHARAVHLGESAANALMRTLGGRLQGALAEGGPAHAIEFCAGEAQALTDSVAESLGEGWVIRRTTDRPRNPANTADETDGAALRRFHAAEAAGEPLENHVVRTPDGAVRYYRPLRVAGLCVQCHGPAESLAPAVRTALAERYPEDAAVGYAEGDLRGLVRVTVPAAAVLDPAERSGP